jgi:hypothetical protein
MFTFLSYLRIGYLWIMPLVLITFLLAGGNRNLLKNFIGIANTIMLIAMSINLFCWGYNLFIVWYGQNTYEQWVFSNNAAVTYSSLFTSIVLDFILTIFLLFKKMRLSAWFSIITWLCSLNRVVAFIAAYVDKLFFKDYLPSSWSTYDGDSNCKWVETILSILLFVILSALIYGYKKLWLNQKSPSGKK